MMHSIFRFLAPRGGWDTVGKVTLFSGLIVLLNYLFHHMYFGGIALPHLFVITNSICVGTPFVLLFFFMVKKQVDLQRELATRSRTDFLTGLANRRWFLKQVQGHLSEGESGVLLIMDADHFKRVNDTYGHQIGDNCLVSIAYRLTRSLRTDDIIGRIGGEEFGVFLTNTSLRHTGAVCRDILAPIPFSGGPDHPHLSVTLSMGAVAACPADDLDDLMRRADEALYRAKANGRARLEFALSAAQDRDTPGLLQGLTTFGAVAAPS